jgi:hypothetical protein
MPNITCGSMGIAGVWMWNWGSSTVRADDAQAQHFGIFSHEMGHNWGLGHAHKGGRQGAAPCVCCT